MPNYTFVDHQTGETFDKSMSIAEKEEWLEANPHIEQLLLKFPAVCDSVRIGVTKNRDHTFNSKLRAIKKTHRGSTIDAPNVTEV